MDNVFLLMTWIYILSRMAEENRFHLRWRRESLGMLLFLVRNKLLFVIFETWKATY